jgi:hypothetical protein
MPQRIHAFEPLRRYHFRNENKDIGQTKKKTNTLKWYNFCATSLVKIVPL